MTGPELDDADDATVDALVAKASVFARVSPAHMVTHSGPRVAARRVRRRGHGDGANDAPAIRRADVGIALGEQATAAARQSAGMIVLDGRIETIAGVVQTPGLSRFFGCRPLGPAAWASSSRGPKVPYFPPKVGKHPQTMGIG